MRFLTIPLLLCSLALAACGGSGGDVGGIIEDPVGDPPVVTPPPPESIGLPPVPYYAVGAASASADAYAIFTGEARGASNTRLQMSGSSNVSGDASSQTFESEYFLDADRALEVSSPDGPAGTGGFGADDAYGVFANVDASGIAQMFVVMQSDDLVDMNQVVGKWHTAWLGHSFVPAGIAAQVRMDTAVAQLGDIVANINGTTQTPPSASVDVTAANDRFVMDPAGDPILGALSKDGNVIVAGGGLTPGSEPVIHVYVRHATGMSDASLQGEYHVTWMARENGHWTSHVGTMTFDGTGTGRYEVRSKSELGTGSKSGPMTYAVSSNGGLVLRFGSANTIVSGGLTQDGRFAAAGGSLTDTAGPTLVTLVRK